MQDIIKNMMKNIKYIKSVVLLSFLMLIMATSVKAEDSICAVVKIEILQELTLERQGFEAELKIGNVLDSGSIDNISINVWFKDENEESVLATSNPNDTTAKFFIDIQSMQNINDVSGNGTIAAGEEAIVKWLIIPAPGASGGRERGTLYFVGADFNYTLEGTAETITVAPDTIYVKPMPLLTLDYFLPRNVYGDDPFTDEVEASEPFTLGVRVQNNGYGDAHKLKIDSAQPKIVENEQGLLISFELLSSYVGNDPVNNSLLLDFGDIEANQSKVGRWQMQVSLSGRFTEFGATFTHADELGGQLTSLLEATNTHFLIHDVVNDIAGRDDIRDFLAEGLASPRLFESDGTTSDVQDISADATFEFEQNAGEYARYKMTLPLNTGLIYAKVSDPLNGNKQLAYVTRSDGKSIHQQNAWLSRVQDRVTHNWSHYVNLFDANGTQEYYFYYQDIVIPPKPPVIAFIPQRITHETADIGFVVNASDPDGNPVSISANPLPQGASFTDNGDGTASFNWTPAVGQAGLYPITYIANDGSATSSKTATIVVHPHDDIDGDGLNDDWEREHFGNLDQDAFGDFDGDGISNLTEFENGTNPAVPDGPPTPTVFTPAIDGEVTQLPVELSVENGIYDGPHEVIYQFELYADEGMTERLDYYNSIAWDTDGVSSWTPSIQLDDNKGYYWRARAYDGFTYSSWANGHFFVNTVNDLPSIPTLSAPALGAELIDTNPKLEVGNSQDIDRDSLYYNFKVYSDSDLQNLVADSGVVEEGSDGMTAWMIGLLLNDLQTYYWKVSVTDEHNASVETDVFNFVWRVSNQAPPAPTIVSPIDNAEVTRLTPELKAGKVIDPNNDPVEYIFQLDRVNTFDSAELVEQLVTVDETQANVVWTLSGLNDNSTYFWRVKARDPSLASSDWVSASFFVNTENDVPSVPVIKNPGHEAWVDSRTPLLEVFSSSDLDNDPIRYEFEVYADEAMSVKVMGFVSNLPEWQTYTLNDNSYYYWRARALDNEDATSNWTALNSFYVNDNEYDDPPTFTWLAPLETIKATPNTEVQLAWQDKDSDSSAVIRLYYSVNEDGSEPIVIAENIAEDADAVGDSYSWNIGELELGFYYIFGEISDANSTITAKAPGLLEAIPEPIIPGNVIVTTEPLIDLYEVYQSPVSKSFTVHLDKEPKANVIVPIINPEPLRFTISASSLTFNADNWNTPQSVILTPLNNCFVDGHVNYEIGVDFATSDDKAFDQIKGDNVKVMLYNDDPKLYAENQTSLSENLAICGLVEKNHIVLSNSTHQYEYVFYLKNLANQTIEEVEIELKSKQAQIKTVSDSIGFPEMAPQAISKSEEQVMFVVYNALPAINWLNPGWYELIIDEMDFD